MLLDEEQQQDVYTVLFERRFASLLCCLASPQTIFCQSRPPWPPLPLTLGLAGPVCDSLAYVITVLFCVLDEWKRRWRLVMASLT